MRFEKWAVAATAVAIAVACCAPKPALRLIVSMQEEQEAYYRDELVPAFEKTYPSVVEVVHYDDADSLESILRQDPGTISLIKVPFEKAGPLMRSGVLMPLDSVLDKDELRAFDDTYLMTSLGSFDNRRYLIPQRFGTHIMVYRKSRVADVTDSWRNFRDTISTLLKNCNGYGLPATYLLEDDPQKWDYYDIFVLGWIWSHMLYEGRVHPRVAHSGKHYSGTFHRMIDRITQLGGDSAAVMAMEGDAVIDAVYWEALYTANNVYNGKMWSEQWSGQDILRRFGAGELFLTFMTQSECFSLYGADNDSSGGRMSDPDDVGVATMPLGCSFDLDTNGIPRYGTKAVTTNGWWWAIPAGTPDRRLSYRLASFITSAAVQIQECSRFGMIPVRKDILGDMTMLFSGGWIGNMYDASFRQMVLNGYTVIPGSPDFTGVGRLYLDILDEVVAAKGWAPVQGANPQRQYIIDVVAGTYQPKIARRYGTAP